MEPIALIVVTVPTLAVAEEMVTKLVEERLVACGNIVPGLTSIYRWKGNVERADELLVIFKTRAAMRAILERRITELHPYEVPEIVTIAPSAVSAAYAQWVCAETTNE